MFWDNYLSMCVREGKTPTGVGKELGISKTTISFWKSGRSSPTDATIFKIAEYFNVDFHALKEGRVEYLPEIAPPREKQIIESEKRQTDYTEVILDEKIRQSAEFATKYAMLPDHQKKLISDLIDTFLSNRK